MSSSDVFVWVSLGSNHDRDHQIARALDELYQRFGELVISRIYETQPVGLKVKHCAPFYNLIAGFFTSLPPGELNRHLKEIEGDTKYLCPEDKSIYARALDLDLVAHGDKEGQFEGVQLPYKQLLKHDFVLRPLAELAPHEQAPGQELSWSQLWQKHAHPEQKMQAVDFTWRGRQISSAIN
ncbi:2-amino-4-hydroxy-6-hydroxymethyldihydropteridine diphosphokinase [Marinospirillum perlucidum]|uniref:2-amino-4-hydroxy-6- hydroxymethyldihydropteridine diphosphokinase n=1 Tax=Marinospirillum perlucidum TaxID=1982602 RepID=UPI000DF41EFF|nr:2-amino-4-hydroxy-6-hydroxymethyldihydropteridine diphosphokinase [Marinospirillum perlucidum]